MERVRKTEKRLKAFTRVLLLFVCVTSTSTDRYANVDVGVLLYHIERFPGIIILTTNLIENIDKAFFRRLRFVLHFETPLARLRARLWKVSESRFKMHELPKTLVVVVYT